MITEYNYRLTNFPNGKVSLDRLTNEIRTSDITISLNYLNSDELSVYIFFKDSLPIIDKQILDNLISNHKGEPILDSIPIVKAELLTEQTEYVLSGNILPGYYSAESITIPIGTSPYEIKDLSWKFDISLKSSTINVSDNMIGDELEIEVSPNTLVGALTSNLNTGDTILYVSDTVIKNAKRGWYIGLYSADGISTDIGRIIDLSNDHITIDRESSVSSSIGSYLCISVKIIPYVYFNTIGKIEIGKSIPTGQRIDKNTIIRIKYTNNNQIEGKKISFFVEYLY